MSTERGTPAKRMAPERRRSHLVAVAIELFAAKPYEEVSLEEVAEAAAVTRALLYHYFPDGKPGLFAAAFRESVASAVAAIDSDPDRDRHEKLSANLRMFIDLAERGDPVYAIYREGRRVNDPAFQSFLDSTRSAIAAETAFNQLGTREPGPVMQLALEGFAVFMDHVVSSWADGADLSREQVETLLAGVLQDVISSAKAVS